MSRELWIDIHDYTPPSTGEGSTGLHDAGGSITKAKKHGVEVQGCADESLNQEMSKNNDR